MVDLAMLEAFLAGARVDPSVFALRLDYRALVLAVDRINSGPSDEVSDVFLSAAEQAAREALGDAPPDALLHVAASRDAYREFGAKPQRTRSSLEALFRRVPGGRLPRVNRLTDICNAISILHQLPVGGEDIDRYIGAPRLVRASGEEPFDTMADGMVGSSTPSLARSCGATTPG